MKQANIKIGDW